MKIVHITNSDSEGGASIAAYRLHKAMIEFGLESTVLVIHKNRTDSHIKKTLSIFERILASFFVRLERFILRKYSIYGTFSISKFGFDLSRNKYVKDADVIYLHWINGGMLSVDSIERILSLGKPVYYFMHDMWPLTGGCHHSFECTKYQTHCGECPLLNSHEQYDIAYEIHEQKLKRLNKYDNLRAITPSHWLGGCAKLSHLFSTKRTLVIPNLIDTSVFLPLNKEKVRKCHGLPLDKKIILFAAISAIDNVYKGWTYLVESFDYIDVESVEVIVVGSDYNERVSQSFPSHVRFMGIVRSDSLLAEYYSAADVFVIPSLADNFPNTIVESLSCGTPVVGFNVGGIPDLITHKYNGYLAQTQSARDLALGVKWVLSENQEELSFRARNTVLNNYSYDKLLKYHSFLIDSDNNE